MYKKLIERLRERAEVEQAGYALMLETPYIMHKAADAIETLQASNNQVTDTLRRNGFGNIYELLVAYEQVKRERDDAVDDLTAAGLCDFCGHWNGSKCTKRGKCEFVWRGLMTNEHKCGD